MQGNAGCCRSDCTLQPAGTVCRAAEGDCDLPEDSDDDPFADLGRLAGDPGLFALPLRRFRGVLLVDLLEALAQLGKRLVRGLDPFDRGQALLFQARDLPLDGVDLLEEGAVFALIGDPVDLLLVALQFLLRL